MIKALLSEELIIYKLEATSKLKAIEEMIEQLDRSGKLVNKLAYQEAVLKREAEFTTGIGMGIAIPHGKSDGVISPALVFARSESGVEFESMDGTPAHLLFLIAVPNTASEEHLKILGMLSRKLMHQSVREQLMKAESYGEIIEILS